MVAKLEQTGKVAVLYSPGYGAGWYSWNGSSDKGGEALLFDPVIAQAVLDKRSCKDVLAICEERYPHAYCGGVDCKHGLEIEWVEKGTPFLVHEYDGAESIWYAKDLILTA